jgi:hypothetical protein
LEFGGMPTSVVTVDGLPMRQRLAFRMGHKPDNVACVRACVSSVAWLRSGDPEAPRYAVRASFSVHVDVTV